MTGTIRKPAAFGASLMIVAAGLIGCGGADAATPQQVADVIAQNDVAMRQAIDSWRAGGDPPSTPPPTEVVDRSADLQEEIELLGDHPNLARQVVPLLPAALRPEIQRLYTARRALLKLAADTPNKKLKLGTRPPLADLVGFYDEAERGIGISHSYLAAIHLVETKFGRVVNNSVAGAQGPMQFIPSTWEIYGRGGNIRDPHDSILAAARLLRANGAPANYGPALRAYNNSGLYVTAVTKYAKAIGADPYALYFLYTWDP
jgi:soluble lytic murein transglycosylase-like protein